MENSVDLYQQADFDSSRMFTHDIINDSLLKALYCQINYHNLVSIHFFPNKFIFYVPPSKRKGYNGFGVDPIGMNLFCKISHDLVG